MCVHLPPPRRVLCTPSEPLQLPSTPSVELCGLPAEGTRDQRNAALRRTAATTLPAAAYFHVVPPDGSDDCPRRPVPLPAAVSGPGYVIIDFGHVTRARVHLELCCDGPAPAPIQDVP